jgi:hypothetical protein
MKVIPILLLLLFQILYSVAQSPFNYGHNREVFFISAELREELGIDEILTVDQLPEGDRGGMNENWDIWLISFDSTEISDEWYPTTLDTNFVFQMDSLRSHMHFLNGNRYEFSGDQVVSYGGGGYGSFDWREISHVSDTLSVVSKSCVGHCGDQPVRYSKNVYNRKGQLIYNVRYPDMLVEIDEENAGKSIANLESAIRLENEERMKPDTLYYSYNRKGLLVAIGENAIKRRNLVLEEIQKNSRQVVESEFLQCFIGDLEMEKFLMNKIGFTPKTLLIEIYRQGVFTFTLNPSMNKYYRGSDIILEE